jgi:membrane protease YdiL (CAAX protease family)
MPSAITGEPQEGNAPPRRGRELRAGTATGVFLVYFASQMAGSIGAAIIGVAVAAGRGQNLQDPQQIARLVSTLMPGIVLGTMVGGAVGMFIMAFVLVPEYLRDRSPTGAAWVRGEWRDAGKGLALGLILGAAGLMVLNYLERFGDPNSAGPLTKMATSSTSGFVIWILAALVLAPLVEEPLFRGVLYGGFRRSFGVMAAGIITSAIFVLLHITEIIFFLPAILPLAALAAGALWVRLRFTAIGPAIALHFGYNAIMVLEFFREIR